MGWHRAMMSRGDRGGVMHQGEDGSAMPEVVILCGGRGTRLRPETDVTPKPLIQVAGKALVWHIMTHHAKFGLRRFVLCLGYKGDLIREYFLNFHFRNGACIGRP